MKFLRYIHYLSMTNTFVYRSLFCHLSFLVYIIHKNQTNYGEVDYKPDRLKQKLEGASNDLLMGKRRMEILYIQPLMLQRVLMRHLKFSTQFPAQLSLSRLR